MDKYQKETYIKANEYYQAGEYEKARRLWESLHGKNILKTQHGLVWKSISSAYVKNKFVFFGLFLAVGLLVSLFFGRINYLVYMFFYEFIQYKKSPDLYIFFAQHSALEDGCLKKYFETANFYSFFYNPFDLINETFGAMGNYLISKFSQTHLYFSYIFSIDNGVTNFNRGFATTIVLFPLSFAVFSFSLFFDLYLLFKFTTYLKLVIVTIAKSTILIKRFVVVCFVLFFLSSFYYMFFIHFEKSNAPQFDLMSMFGGDKNGQGEGEPGEKKEMSESEFLDQLLKSYSEEPLSIKEREQIEKILKDIQKAMQKLNIKGSQGEYSEEMKKMIKEGRYKEIFELLKQMKANEKFNKMSKNNGVPLTEKDKEFAEVLKQSFKSSSQKTLDEYMKTSKELNELYGKGIHEKIFGNDSSKELLEKFKNNPEGAKNEMRNKAREALRKEMENAVYIQNNSPRDVNSEMNTIINYLEGGGDIKVFNQLRVKFFEKYKDPNVRFYFAKKLDFVIASWNEHQNKYFWEMNRELMMETIDMVKTAANAVGYDERGLSLGWFYLVAGNYVEARKHCLESAAFNEMQMMARGGSEMAYVNRSNAALAALMLGEGRMAFIEYKRIQNAIYSKTGFSRRDREEYFAEYLREITAAIASPNPCKEGFLCRSLFLEGVDDDLALRDLIRYLALSPGDQLLEKEAELKLKLLKERLKTRNE